MCNKRWELLRRRAILWFAPVGLALVALLALPAAASAPASKQPQAARIAKAIVKAPNLRAAVTATTEALREAGISVVRGNRLVARGRKPLAPNRLDYYQVVQMAMEARRANAGRLTLRDFGHLLAVARVVPRSKSDKFVVALMNGWVASARKSGSQHTFVPLFLAERAKRRLPQVDLARRFRPQDVRITGLDLMLLASAIDRGVAAKPIQARSLASSAAFKPCKEMNKVLDPLGLGLGFIPKELAGKEAGTLNDVLKNAVKNAIDKGLTEGTNLHSTFTNLYKLAKILARWESLMLFYSSAEIRPFPQPDEVHRPHAGRPIRAGFSAVAGLNDQAKKELEKSEITRSAFVRALRDCASAAGIPIPDDLQDIAEGLDKWRVHWSEFGWPQNVIHANSLARVNAAASRFDAGQFAHKLKRISDTEGAPSSPLVIDVQPEPADVANDPDSVEVREAWGLKAELVSSQPPSIKFLRSMIEAALKQDRIGFGLGVVDAINDILVNWTRRVVTPSNRTTITIVSHVSCTQKPPEPLINRAIAATSANGPTCGLPTRFQGTFSGVTDGNPQTVFSGKVTLVRNERESNEAIAVYSIERASATVTTKWNESICGNGETWTDNISSGPQGGSSIEIYVRPTKGKGHFYSGGAGLAGHEYEVLNPCRLTPDPTDTVPYTPHAGFVTIGTENYTNGKRIKGSSWIPGNTFGETWDLKAVD